MLPILAIAFAISCSSEREPAALDAAPPPDVRDEGWPGKTGLSGVNGDPEISRASVEAFCNWRGRECPVAHGYTDRRDWDAMTRENSWLYDNFAGYPGTLIISQGLTPNFANADLADCADGDYDDHWRDFGRMMVARGRANSVVRLGWEFNADHFGWAATDQQDWIQCYRRAAIAIRSVNPKVKLDWTVNAHGTPPEMCGGDSTNCYPGDDVVDIIGIDNYDMGPSAATEEEFLMIANAPDGLNWVHDVAKQKGKKMSVGEWGIAPISEFNTTGENPNFIRWMHEWFTQNEADIAYEMYFSACDGSVGSNLRIPQGASCKRYNPEAAQVYRELFGNPGDANGGDDSTTAR